MTGKRLHRFAALAWEEGMPQAEGELSGIIAVVSESGGIEGMFERLRAGEVRALARAVSLVEDGSAGGAELVRACREGAGDALLVGITGPPGAGKSTLVD